MSTKSGTRDLLLKHRPRRIEPVTVPADFPDPEIAGAEYHVQALTAAEKDQFDQTFLSKEGKLLPGRAKQLRLRLLVRTVVTPQGMPVFTLADLAALGQVDTGLIDLLVSKAQELNRVTDAEIEDAEKN